LIEKVKLKIANCKIGGVGFALVAGDGSGVVPGQGLACRRRSLNRAETNLQFAIFNFTFSMIALRNAETLQCSSAALPGV
jgi:hypothetical protein